ncbi:MAG: 30S ribosomal protein S8 [SAR202 cluster bacterium]|jgi:small subunit ribosomal protein S8|nr:30S ribosomal protein S8 [SAR202 cluster bacterium]|tara:strand:- start:4239 stop:4646 length:408 start_codon:yes stop_codon:yes gene_type:complete
MHKIVTDPIGDMLTRIRNGVLPHHESVEIPASKIKIEIANILRDEGFIKGYELLNDDSLYPIIKIYLSYSKDGTPLISGLKRVSKPGLRVYVGKHEIPRHYAGLAVAILSTSQGVITGKSAWKSGVGGELLCYIW